MTRPFRPSFSSCIALAVLLLASRKSMSAALENAANADLARVNLWAVRVNGATIADFAKVVLTPDKKILLAREQLAAARLLVPSVAALRVDGEEFFPLDAIPGAKSDFDTATQTLVVTAPPAAFTQQNFGANDGASYPASTSGTGAILNYDLTHTRSQNATATSLLSEAVFFSPVGALANRAIAVQGTAVVAKSFYRLDTQFTRDFPKQLAQLVVGDSLSGASGIGRQIYFGGLQWKTNFALRPDYQPLPLPSLSGVAAVPSVIDIYVDNVLRRQQPVDTGPFSVTNLPLVSGQGNIQLVVNDVLGRQQIISQSYLIAPQLLKKDAHDFSFEAGRERIGLGSAMSRYGAPFGSATYRVGLDAGTVEAHGELASHRQVAGLGFATVLMQLNLLAVGASASHSLQGAGQAGFLQLSRSSGGFGFSGRVQLASARFRQLGLDDASTEPTRQVQLQLSKNLTANSNVTLSYLERVVQLQPVVRVVASTLNIALPKRAFFSLALTRLSSVGSGWSINASMFMPLGSDQFSQVGLSRQNGSEKLTVEFQQSAPQEKGWGYRARQTLLDRPGSDIGVNYNGSTGQYAMSASQQGGQRGLQLQARGAVATIGGHVVATRWIDDSFAVVEVPIDDPVDVYANNQLVSKTKDGVGIIPRLVPHVFNRIFLDAQTLPLNVSLDLSDKQVVPASRSGLLLKFDAHADNSAMIELVDAQDKFLPPATVVSVNGGEESYEVGLRGLVFVPNTVFPMLIEVRSDRLNCRATIPQPFNVLPMAKLGPYVCEAIKQ